MRVYENMIKNMLFIQFQEAYKAQEGEDLKQLFLREEQKTRPGQPPKKGRSVTPDKRQREPTSGEKPATRTTTKSVKQAAFKKQEYGEVDLAEFMDFFGQVMVVQDFRSFLVACKNVCVLKKKQKKVERALHFEEEKQPAPEEAKQPASPSRVATRSRRHAQEKQELVICLNIQVLKDMVAQFGVQQQAGA